MLRGYALKAVREVLESGVQAVDAVDGVHGRVPAFQRRAESFEDGGVGPGLVSDDEGTLADTAVQCLVGTAPCRACDARTLQGRMHPYRRCW